MFFSLNDYLTCYNPRYKSWGFFLEFKMKEPQIQIKNIDESYDLPGQMYVPSIIRWICPVCGGENEIDCRYGYIENSSVNEPFVYTLICDHPGCEYQRDILLRINMNLELLRISEEDDKLRETYEDYFHKDGKQEAFRRELRKNGGIFVK